MNIFADTEPPRWLQEAARPVDTAKLGAFIGTNLAEVATALQKDPNAASNAGFWESRKGLTEGIAEVRANQNDQFWKLKTAQMQNNMAASQARTTAELATASEKFRETSAWMEDAPKLAAWATATPDQRKELPSPEVKSKTGLGIVQKTVSSDDQYFTRKQAVENQSTAAKIVIADTANFRKRISTLDPDLRASIEELKPQRDGSPSSVQLTALNLAEQTHAQRRKDTEDVAVLEAKRRGETPTVTIGPKGVTTTYKPNKPVVSPEDNQPATKTLSDGTVLAWMPKGNTIHVIKGNDQKKLTASQLLAIANKLPDGDTNKMDFVNAAKSAAFSQIKPTPVDLPKKDQPATMGSRARMDESSLPKTPTGKPITDNKGNKWLYKGTAADPKTDHDPANWVAQ
jgi:hypothetical protein